MKLLHIESVDNNFLEWFYILLLLRYIPNNKHLLCVGMNEFLMEGDE